MERVLKACCEHEEGEGRQPIRIANFHTLRFANHSRAVIGWSDAARSNSSTFRILLGEGYCASDPPANTYSVLSQYAKALRKQGNLLPEKLLHYIDNDKLCDHLQKPVCNLLGPPGTGKTLTSILLVQSIASFAKRRSSTGKACCFLHLAWNKSAIRVMIRTLLDNQVSMANTKCVFVGSPEELNMPAWERSRILYVDLAHRIQKDGMRSSQKISCSMSSSPLGVRNIQV